MLTSLLADISVPLALLPEWLSPQEILTEYGFWAILVIIFAETGLLIGFFLPGDTLLLSAGILVRLHEEGGAGISEPLWLLLVAVPLAAIAGNLVGYEIGRRAGPALFTKEDSKLFRKDHLDRSHAFFEKYGPITIFLARFVPIVRTFAAVVAGAVGMNHRLFVLWSVLGAIAWCTGLILVGYLLALLLPQSTVDFIEGHIDLVIVGVVVLTVLGIVVEQLRHKKPAVPVVEEVLDHEPAHAGEAGAERDPDPVAPTDARSDDRPAPPGDAG